MTKENNDLEKLLKDENLTREQKNQAINKYFEDYRKEIDNELNKYILRQNIGTAIEIGSAALPIGAGAKATEIGYKLVEPIAKQYGKKVAERIGQGIVGGTAAGAVHGLGSSIANPDKNPIAEILKDTAGGTLAGGLGSVGLSKAEQYLSGKSLQKLANSNNLSREQLKLLRNKAKDYYNNYINSTSVFRKDIGKINFGTIGIKEQVSKGLHNVGVLPDLKNQIKTGIYKRAQKDYPRDDIKQFHIIENKLKNKNYEYQIAEDTNDKKYYLVKNGKKAEVPPTYSNHNPGLEATSNTSITDVARNFNPGQVAIFPVYNQNTDTPLDSEPLKGYIRKNDYKFEDIPMADPVLKNKGIQNSSGDTSGAGHIFSPSEIDKMTNEEFTQNEQNIMQQVRDGLIQPDNQQINYSGYSNPVNGSKQIFSKESIDAMTNEEYTKNEEAINAQLNSIGIPSNDELQAASKNGGGTIYVKSYTRSDGTKVRGYYRSL